MASRQGGVHISYLVVAIVICLGLIGVVVVMNSENADMVKEVAKARGEVTKKDDQIDGYLKERKAARELLHGDPDTTPDYASMQEWLTKAGAELAKAYDSKDATSYVSLQDFMNDSMGSIVHWRERFQTQEAAAQNKDAEYESVLQQKQDLQGQRDEEIARLNGKVNDLQVEGERVQSEARAQEEELREELETKEDEMTAQISVLQRDLYIERNLHKKTKQRLEHLREEIRVAKTFDKVEPDGEIVQVSDELGFAWINIGQDDRVRKGTVFDVFSFVKGGRRLLKGKAEVVDVEANMAQVSIRSLVDDLNPMLPGDKIASPFYKKENKPIFVIAGDELRNRQLSLETLGRKIGQYGGTIEDKVRVETTYVVAISGYENTSEYKDARDLGITVLREEELLGFLGY